MCKHWIAVTYYQANTGENENFLTTKTNTDIQYTHTHRTETKRG
jgi:hypothetical protein